MWVFFLQLNTMKIIRYFITHESEETGVTGFLPLWIPKSSNFDPSDATGMVHDMLEHRLCDQGHLHEELMAFGRAIALRVATYFYGKNRGPSAEGMGSEIATAWVNELNSGDLNFPHAPKTVPIKDDFVEETIQSIATKAMQDIATELSFYTDSKRTNPNKQLHSAMVGWMRIGYLDAVRRYKGTDHGCYEVAHSAFTWAKSTRTEQTIGELINEHVENGNLVLRLCYDTDRHQMSMKDIHIKDQGFPQWLRQRIDCWKYSDPQPIKERIFEYA